METDPFNDSIRRKLESIRPDFEEKDWKRMQATLQQAAPPPSDLPTSPLPFTVNRWSSARPWLLAAATVSAVVLVSFAAWQQTQISNLRQTVSQLRQQQTTRPRQAPSETAAPDAVALPSDGQTARRGEAPSDPVSQPANRDQATTSRTDTVYITRYVPVPAQPANPAPGRTAQRSANAPAESSADRVDRVRSLANAQSQQQRSAQSTTSDQRNDVDVAENVSPVADERTNAPDNTSPVVVGTAKDRTNGKTNRAGNRLRSTNSSTRRTDEQMAMRPSIRPETNVLGGRKRPSGTQVQATDKPADSDLTRAAPTGSADERVSSGPGQPTATNQSTATYELATGRPPTLKTIDWNQALARQTKRMRPVRTTTVGGQAAPVTQPASQPVRVAFGVRAGAWGEISRTVRSGGVLSELLIGKHLTLGVGVGLASFAGGTFPTPEKFDERKHKKEYRPGGEFKREYVFNRGIDPRSDITNIGMHVTRVQLPISLGYRIPISRTLSLLPSVGTTLSLQGREFVTFTYRLPFRIYEEASRHYDRPVDVNLLNNLTFGAGVEWKRNHWVVQAGPVVTVPLVADANWEESTSVGLRARVFYQF